MHTDLDGVASAAIYLRLSGGILGTDTRLFFAEPYNLPRVLESISGDTERIVIADLGVNSGSLDKVVKALRKHTRVSAIEWYDHHQWLDDWKKRIRDLGVELFIDQSTCSAGVVAKYAPRVLDADPDPYVWELVEATCAADLWRWDHPMAPRLFRVVDRYRGRRGDAWRRNLVKGFAEGSLWWPELDEALNEYIRLEFEGYDYALRHAEILRVNECQAVLTLKKPGPPSPSIIGNALMERFSADFAVIVRTRGRGMSFRSRGVDVQEIAVTLGGGGHRRAAGAPLDINLLYRLLAYIYPRIKLAIAKKKLKKVLEERGCKKIEGEDLGGNNYY